MDITQHDGESDYDYHKRIIYGKLVDKTLTDIDYTELADLCYGQPYSSDVARRMFYGSKRTLDIVEKQKLNNIDNDVAAQIDDKIAELQKERQKYYDQRREYNKILNKEAREEHLQETLIAAADNLRETVGCVYSGDDISKTNQDYIRSDTEAILVFSDWHFGLVAKNIFNEYDTSICKERVRDVTIEAAKRLRLHKCSKLHVIVLGDLCHGAIHTSARVASEELVCDQIMQASELLAQSIEYLSSFVSETEVYVTYGNHARTVQNKNDSIHRDNMERLVPWWLNERLSRYENITVEKDNGTEFVFADVCGYNICATHGDNDSVKTSPRLLPTLFQKAYGKDVDYILLGDKHHSESFDELGVVAMLCGSLCGTDDYANSKRLYSCPSQLLLIFNEDSGLDAEYRVKCKI